MKVAPLASALLLVAAPAIAQSSPEDNDKRSVQAYFYELTPLKPKSDCQSASKKDPLSASRRDPFVEQCDGYAGLPLALVAA